MIEDEERTKLPVFSIYGKMNTTDRFSSSFY